MKRPVQPSEQAAVRHLLVRLRTSAGVNQTTLATRLGITQSEVSKFERGERALDERRLRAWVRALGVEWAASAEPTRAGEPGHVRPSDPIAQLGP